MATIEFNHKVREQSYQLASGLIASLCLCLLFFSSLSFAQQNDIDYLLQQDMRTSVTITLPNNEEPSASEQIDIPVIKHEARQAIVKGFVVFIGDVQEQGFTDHTLLRLSQLLPDWGWNTLLVTPKVEYFAKPSVNDENQSASEENDSSAPDPSQISSDENASNTNENSQTSTDTQNPSQQTGLKPYEFQAPELAYSAQQYDEFVATLLSALQSKFMQSAGYQVVYVRGKSASSLLTLLSNDTITNIDALVMNSPYWPMPTENLQVAKNLASTQIPVLDLLNQSDSQWSHQTAQKRVIEARVSLKPLYRQRKIIGIDANSRQSEYIAKEVAGFLHFLGW